MNALKWKHTRVVLMSAGVVWGEDPPSTACSAVRMCGSPEDFLAKKRVGIGGRNGKKQIGGSRKNCRFGRSQREGKKATRAFIIRECTKKEHLRGTSSREGGHARLPRERLEYLPSFSGSVFGCFAFWWFALPLNGNDDKRRSHAMKSE